MPAWFRGLASVVVSAALICAPVTASAQDKDADNKAAAKEHWSRGTSFYDLGRYDQAITEFEAAYQLKDDPAFLFNLAQAYRMAGKHERAVHFYKTYLRYVPKAPNRADIEEKIKTGEQLAAQQSAEPCRRPPRPPRLRPRRRRRPGRRRRRPAASWVPSRRRRASCRPSRRPRPATCRPRPRPPSIRAASSASRG